MSRAKDIGTRAETAVVRYARANGFAGAERRALHGAHDVGDVALCPGAILEVKSRKSAPTDAQVARWLRETLVEACNADAEAQALVVKRPGFGPDRAGDWWAWARLGWTLDLPPGTDLHLLYREPVCTSLRTMLRLIRAAGFGDVLGPAELEVP